jgi:hypothetical protein
MKNFEHLGSATEGNKTPDEVNVLESIKKEGAMLKCDEVMRKVCDKCSNVPDLIKAAQKL